MEKKLPEIIPTADIGGIGIQAVSKDTTHGCKRNLSWKQDSLAAQVNAVTVNKAQSPVCSS